MKKNKPFGELFYRSLKKTYLIMRITLVLMILGILQVNANDAIAQNKRISINFSDTKLVNVLDKIEDESEFVFMYNERLMDTERKVSINAKEELITEILDDLFNGTDVKYTIIDHKIILAPESLSNSQPLNSVQQSRITGTITDKAGMTLPGVNVLVTGTTQGVISDIEGKYTIVIPAGAQTLQFSFIGMISQTIAIGTQTQINVTMLEMAIGLDEVVVVGYGTQSKRNMASSTAVINSKDIAGMSVSDPRQALQGKISGVQVINNSGNPGSGAKIVVRGMGSFSNAEPLYVIDGIQGGDLNSINPADIENITILKDASSTAIYGAAAANGVVVISTKSGKKGAKTQISYEGSVGVANVVKRMDMLNSAQYIDLVTDIQKNNGLGITAKLQTPDVLIDQTDWQEVLFKSGVTTEHTLRIDGGGDAVAYSFSAGYLDEKSTTIDLELKRFTLGSKLTEYIFNNRLRLNQSIRLKNDRTDGASTNTATTTMRDAFWFAPYSPTLDPTNLGGFAKMDKLTDLNDANNVLNTVYNKPGHQLNFNVDLDVNAEIDLFRGLMFKSQARLSTSNQNYNQFIYPNIDGNNSQLTPSMSESYSQLSDWLVENYLSYDKTFGQHNITGLIGTTYDPQAAFRSVLLSGSGFSNTTVQNIALAPTAVVLGGKVGSLYSRLSYFGRLGYMYKGKYTLNLSVRRDGSSKFGANNRWGNFYGLGAAWVISDEAFLTDVEFISNLKLRVSYGKTGNDNIPPFLTSSNVYKGANNNIVYSFGDTDAFAYGSTVVTLPNPNLKWEETRQLGVGTDISVMRNKLNLIFDYFYRRNSDLLIETTLPSSTGLGTGSATQWVNAAAMKNYGFEAALSYSENVGAFKYDVSINATYNKNEVTALGTVNSTPISSSYTRTDIGQPLASFYGYKVDHIVVSQAELDALNTTTKAATGVAEYQVGMKPGDRMWQDIDGNGYVNSSDRTFIGQPSPKWQYGITANASYKNFDISINLLGLAGVDVWNASKSEFASMAKPLNQVASVLNRWRADGDVTDVPIAGRNSAQNSLPSDWYVEKGDYSRVKNLVIGYTLPKFGLNFLNSLRIYAAAQNLLTLTKYSGFDPEISTADDSSDFIFRRGIDHFNIPNPRILRLGVQIKF